MWTLSMFCLLMVKQVLSKEDVDTRITGGQETSIEDFPHQVSFTLNNGYFCGGFIVSMDYILTAAHCAIRVDQSTMILRAGSSYRNNGTIIPIAEVVSHPEYDDELVNKDVAYMKTVSPIDFTSSIKPINLPPKGRDVADEVTVSGWGRTRDGTIEFPDRLMAVNLEIVNFTQCQRVYPRYLTENMWCAGDYYDGGVGACQGDSGGAAIQDGMAVGIVSFGGICGRAGQPSVFANTAAPDIRDFISSETGL